MTPASEALAGPVSASEPAPRRALVLWATRAAVMLGALAVRVPGIERLGPTERGGDEWYACYRALGVLFEGGNPGTFVHPALYYDASAAVLGTLYRFRLMTGEMRDPVDLFAALARDDPALLVPLQYLSACASALTCVVLLDLGARLYAFRAGLLAAVSFALMPLAVECAQAVRVDSLFALLTTTAGLALHRVWSGGGARAYVTAGAVVGLSASANHPGWYLVLALAFAHFFGGSPLENARARGLLRLGLAVVALVVVYLVTNPALITGPTGFAHGGLVQLSFAHRAHPFREGVPVWEYVEVVSRQSTAFALLSFAGLAWGLVRSRGVVRGASALTLGYLVVFSVIATRFDRYLLPVLPWLALFAAGGLHTLAGASLDGRAGRARYALAIALALVVVLDTGRGPVGEVLFGPRGGPVPDRTELLQGLVARAGPRDGVWVEADTIPILQAAFVDPGGRLTELARRGFTRAFPGADLVVVKGELVEGERNYDPALLMGPVRWAVTCDRTMRYVVDRRPDLPRARAFYQLLERRGVPVVSTERGCHLLRLPEGPGRLRPAVNRCRSEQRSR